MKAFISYASEDRAAVRRLVEDLDRLPEIEPWMDKNHLIAGESWNDAVLREIQQSRFIVLVLSPRSVEKKGYVQTEFKAAIDTLQSAPLGTVDVLPIRLEPCDFPYPELSSLHCIDMFPDWDLAVRSLRRSIVARIRIELEPALNELRLVNAATDGFEELWTERFGAFVASQAPSIVVDELDRQTSKLRDEVYALNVLARTCATNKLLSVAEYLFRMQEVARICYHDYEMPSVYGWILDAATLLTPRLRAVFLRGLLGIMVDELYGAHRGAWLSELVLRDVAKHYVLSGESKSLQGVFIDGTPTIDSIRVERDVVTAVCRVSEWALPCADLLTFVGWNSGAASYLAAALRTVMRSSDPPEVEELVRGFGDRFPGGFETLGQKKVSGEDREMGRVGVILRATYYLACGSAKSPNSSARGAIERWAIDALAGTIPEVQTLFLECDARIRTALLDAIERQDIAYLSQWTGTLDGAVRLARIIPEGVHVNDRRMGLYRPIPIPRKSDEQDRPNA